MSYDIYIGNADIRSEWSDENIRAEWTVEEIRSPDAPIFPNDELTGNSNSRHQLPHRNL